MYTERKKFYRILISMILGAFIIYESAIYIHDKVCTNDKSIHSYSNSKHLMTLGSDQKLIHKDILSFLKQLQW